MRIELKKCLLALLIAVMAVFVTTILTVRTQAADSDSGSVTDTITYTFNGDTGELVISGEGRMWDAVNWYGRFDSSSVPWYSYRSDVTSITIEDGITYIGASMFRSTNAVSVTMADSVTEIGDYAFEYNDSLTDIKISSNVKEIPYYCFYQCEALESIEIPYGVESIDVYAFAWCSMLADVTIPKSVTSIGNCAFYQTPFLEDAESTLIVGDGLMLKYVGDSEVYTAPSNVKQILYHAFFNHDELKTVNLGSSVIKIWPEAFSYCDSLETVNASSSLVSIGYSAFEGTPFDENATEEFVVLGSVLYKYNGDSEVVQIPSGIKSIGSIAFVNNFTLKEVIIPDTVTLIGQQAFMGCTSLDYVYIPASVETIEDRAFGYYFSNITSGSSVQRNSNAFFMYGPANAAASAYASDTGFIYVDESEMSGSCGDHAVYTFDPKSRVLTVSGQGDTYNYIYSTAPFDSFGVFVKNIIVEDGITHVGNYLFSNCTYASTVRLGKDVATLGNWPLRSDYITSIELPAAYSEFNTNTFGNCYNLAEYVVPDDNNTFSTDDGVLYSKDGKTLYSYPKGKKDSEYKISEGTTTISSYAFYGSDAKSVVIPASVTSLEYNAFYSNYSLQSVIFQGRAPSSDQRAFYYNNEATAFYHSANGSWDSYISSNSYISWYDLDSDGGLKLSASVITAEAGSSADLDVNDGTLDYNFKWTTSDPGVAVVSLDGKIIAAGSGSTTITAEGFGLELTCQVNVTGEAAQFSEYASYDIDEALSSLMSTCDPLLTEPFESINGIYILARNALYFYSYAAGCSMDIYEFEDFKDAWISDGILYVLCEDGGSIVRCYDLASQKISKTIKLGNISAEKIGADGSGRIYVYHAYNDTSSRISVYDSDGKRLGSGNCTVEVTRFSGFDDTNGNFYFEGVTTMSSLGYSYGMSSAMAGNFSDGTVYVYPYVMSLGTSSSLQDALSQVDSMYLYQAGYFDRRYAMSFEGGKYLIASSNYSHRLFVVDSNSYDVYSDDHTDISYVMRLSRSAYDTDSEEVDIYNASIGVNAVYNPANDSLIVYKNDKSIEELSIKSGAILSSLTTQNYVFSMKFKDSVLYVTERDADGNLHIEKVDYLPLKSITISGTSSLKVGESAQLEVDNGSVIESRYTWTSSDNSVCTVTDTGKVVAWGTGKATIKAALGNTGIEAAYVITVNPIQRFLRVFLT